MKPLRRAGTAPEGAPGSLNYAYPALKSLCEYLCRPRGTRSYLPLYPPLNEAVGYLLPPRAGLVLGLPQCGIHCDNSKLVPHTDSEALGFHLSSRKTTPTSAESALVGVPGQRDSRSGDSEPDAIACGSVLKDINRAKQNLMRTVNQGPHFLWPEGQRFHQTKSLAHYGETFYCSAIKYCSNLPSGIW